MPVLETIDAALTPLKLKHGVGVTGSNPAISHYVLVPDFESEFEADNEAYITNEHVNIEFYIVGDYRAIVASAKSLLRAADLAVLESRYVEYEKETQKHHYLLAVSGRS